VFSGERRYSMIRTIEIGRNFEITGANPQVIHDELDRAVDLGRDQAMREGRHGILVTRFGHASFVVAVTEDVPYGFTYERDG
jgi:hypothetical protein